MSANIKMIRGTTFERALRLFYEGQVYRLKPGEILRFGVKENERQDRYLIKKEWTYDQITEDAFILTITPQDTSRFPCKKYKYDIGIQRGDNYFIIVPESDFILSNNITSWEGNQ